MPTFSQNMVTAIQAALQKSPLATDITIDGTRMSYADALERLAYFERRVARESGRRPIASAMRLGPGTVGVNV